MKSGFFSGFRSLHLYIALLCLAVPLIAPGPAHPGTVLYSYDETGRLLSESYESGTTINYTYDAMGNRLSREVLNSPGAITLISPNGGEDWEPGTTETIYWKYQGAVGPTVKIELFKGGALNRTISASASTGTGGEGSLEWTIPADQAAGSDYKVKLSSVTTVAISDTSRSSFTIERKPSIAATAPKAGAIRAAGTTCEVTWNFAGDPGSSVKIELIKGGVLDSILSDNTLIGSNGRGSFSWPIPSGQTPGQDYQIRIAAPAAGKSSTSGIFTITGGIAVTYPGPGDKLQAGNSHEIAWTYTGDPGAAVKIELLKGSAVQSVITPSVSVGSNGYGSHSWPIAGELAGAADYRIRISSTTNSAYTETSAYPFTIAPSSITVASPNWNDEFHAGESRSISWYYAGAPGDAVKIELLKGSAVQRVIAPSVLIGSDGQGSHPWSIPVGQPGGTDYRIRITSTINSAFTDTSDESFTIYPTSITMASPNGWEAWQRGSEQTILWNYTGKPGASVKIELLKASVVHSTLASNRSIGANGEGSFPWTIPSNLAPGYDYKVRITSVTNGSYTDVSDNTFSITPAQLQVNSPNGGQFQAGTSQEINWTYTGSPGKWVKIELLKGSAVQRVIAASVSIGSDGWGWYNWAIPAGQPAGTDYRIRITSTSNSAYTDTSNGPFTIVPALALDAPNGGGEYQAGDRLDISWTYAGSPGESVKIELLKGNAVQRVIAAGVSIGSYGYGSYSWPIPAGQVGAADYRIRITSTTDDAYMDTSNGPFTIIPSSITVTYPNGGDELQAGTRREIGWTYRGKPGTAVKIELLKGSAVQRVIAASVPIGSDGYGTYSWPIPAGQAEAADYRIRITSTTNGACTDMSDEPFTIDPSSISGVSPSGGRFGAGTICKVSWYFAGNPGATVNIDLLRGDAWQYTVASGIPIGKDGEGSYNWMIPIRIASDSNYRIQITTARNYSAAGNTTFAITATGLTLMSPGGGEEWTRGSTARITWQYGGNPGNTVRIELRKGGVLVGAITSAAPIGSYGRGYYDWPIPASQAPGNDYRIKITGSADNAYTDMCESDFAIVDQ